MWARLVSGAVFVPQVEVFEIREDQGLFRALGFLFPHVLGVRICRFLDFLMPGVRTLPHVVPVHLQSDGKVGWALADFQMGLSAGDLVRLVPAFTSPSG